MRGDDGVDGFGGMIKRGFGKGRGTEGFDVEAIAFFGGAFFDEAAFLDFGY